MTTAESRLKRTLRLMKQRIAIHVVRKRLSETPFPREVWIENTNLCNARCMMCPRDKHTRPTGIMDFGLFEKIVAEIATHRDYVQRVHFHNFGEPLIDLRLAERISIAKTHGIRHTYFVTNASLLTPDRARELIEAGLDEFKISFYGTNPLTYNTTMRGLDFDKTITNIRDFFRIRRELGRRTPRVVIQYLPQASNGEAVAAFRLLFDRMIDKRLGDQINIFSLHNFGGGREYNKLRGEVNSICAYPWRTMVILHSGDVVLCCLDFNGMQVIGNIRDNSLQATWLGVRMRQARHAFKKLDYAGFPVCLRCDQAIR